MNNQVLGFLGGITLGVLVGATLGLLLAPSSGNDLRQQLRDRAQSVQDEVKQASIDKRAELERELADLRAPRKSVPPSA